MAATLTWKTGQFDPYTRDQASYATKLAKAVLGAGSASERQTARAEIFGRPDFTAEVQATTDTSNLQAVDLTDEGVTFPADTLREIRLRSWVFTDNDRYFQETREMVLGGTTPVLLGQELIGGWSEEAGVAAGRYGNVHLAATITALTTITVIYADTGLALGDISSGAADLSVPRNRLLLVKGACLDEAGVVSATTSGKIVTISHTNLDGAGSGTDAVVFANVPAASDVAAADPLVGSRVDLAFQIWAPFNHRLVMNSNNVEVQVTGDNNIGDDNLKHVVEVYVGKAQPYAGYSAV